MEWKVLFIKPLYILKLSNSASFLSNLKSMSSLSSLSFIIKFYIILFVISDNSLLLYNISLLLFAIAKV